MRATKSQRGAILSGFVAAALMLLVLLPPAALASWTTTDVRIADPYGTGYVGLLNVTVVATAANDAADVTGLELSDDGTHWFTMPYTGERESWVLGGESGGKTLYARFVAADGSVSPVCQAGIIVDTEPPVTQALTASAPRGHRASFTFLLGDEVSKLVKARLVVRGHGRTESFPLGWLSVGQRTARVRLGLPAGRYTWSVKGIDQAHWSQSRSTTGTVVVK